MAKYNPKSKDELVELISDESVNLGDIDTSAIDDMSYLFEDSERTDFSGIEKWDLSKIKNLGAMFEGMSVDLASTICEKF
ncbi:BspA family leucine-rich repeat surface protein [Helicobacter sp. 23-1044]